jgi:hypothetical protein
LGLGSVAYVFLMSLLLWSILLPLRPKNWRYLTVLVFVALTSPPAILYAIPVERFASFDTAQAVNTWFLFIVAVWRVLLLSKFLRTSGGLEGDELLVAVFLPLTLIVSTLAMLNLDHAVFDFMAGLDQERTINDGAFAVVTLVGLVSMLALPILLIVYVGLCFRKRRERRQDETRLGNSEPAN